MMLLMCMQVCKVLMIQLGVLPQPYPGLQALPNLSQRPVMHFEPNNASLPMSVMIRRPASIPIHHDQAPAAPTPASCLSSNSSDASSAAWTPQQSHHRTCASCCAS